MKKFVPLGAIVVLVIGFFALVWAVEFRSRASQTEVTKAAYTKFGPGPRIICVAQDRNNATWYCRSARWGDDPNCRVARVAVTGSIDLAEEARGCEGA